MNKAEEQKELALDCLKQAAKLMSQQTMSNQEFLESMSRSDRLNDHEDNCGMCHHMRCMAEAARELLKEEIADDTIARWDHLAKQKWQESKYFKLYQEEKAAGRNPDKAFEERGWEM